MKIGSLCTGYGGLDMAVQAFYGGEVVWTADNDKHAATLIETLYPDVPNLGDIKNVDWTKAEAVDVITAGYPCQPFSIAGTRKGEDDPRHIFPHIAEAIRILRPRVIVLENVRNHLRLGFGTVLGTLADLGYDCRWGCVRASDAGAPHRRERVFIVATDARGERHGGGQDDRAVGVPACSVEREASEQRTRQVVGNRVDPLLGTPTARDWKDGAFCAAVPVNGLLGRQVWDLLPTPRATDGTKGGPNQRGSSGDLMLPSLSIRLLKTPTANLATNGGSQHPDKRRGGGHGPTLQDEAEHYFRPRE